MKLNKKQTGNREAPARATSLPPPTLPPAPPPPSSPHTTLYRSFTTPRMPGCGDAFSTA